MDDREDQLRSAFLDMLAHLAGASAAYEKFAGSVTKKGERDAFYNTRSKDFRHALVRARRAFKTLFHLGEGEEPPVSKYEEEKRAPNI